MQVLGILPKGIHQTANTVISTYKSHVKIVPSPSLYEYSILLENITPETYWPAYQQSYVQSLGKMSHIKSYFGIEREFDRFYDLLIEQKDCDSGVVNQEGNISSSLSHDLK